MNDAAPIPALTAEVAKEVALLDFMIQEALLIHETTKADALNKQKPVPMTALRFAIQAQKLRLGLLGIAPEPRPRRAPKAMRRKAKP